MNKILLLVYRLKMQKGDIVLVMVPRSS